MVQNFFEGAYIKVYSILKVSYILFFLPFMQSYRL